MFYSTANINRVVLCYLYHLFMLQPYIVSHVYTMYICEDNVHIYSCIDAEAFVISSLLAEWLAILSAMEHVISLQFRRVVFESDSLQLVTAIVDGSSFSDLHEVLSDIYLLSISFDSVEFRFCRREALSLLRTPLQRKLFLTL